MSSSALQLNYNFIFCRFPTTLLTLELAATEAEQNVLCIFSFFSNL